MTKKETKLIVNKNAFFCIFFLDESFAPLKIQYEIRIENFQWISNENYFVE